MQLDGATVVIVGASSGIGRATAHAFARDGANLVLAARGTEKLDRAAAECRALGAEAVAVTADATDDADMRRLVDTAVDHFGGIDVWINNAGIGAVGWFEQVPLAAHRRVIEVDLIGALNGSHAVLRYFVQQGHGVLINTCSSGSWFAPPMAAAYTAAKYGLRGLTEALRQDMRRHPGIAVAAIYPSFVDTPGLRHFANYTGRRLRPGGPLQTPERVARAMVRLARHPRGRLPIGLSSSLARLAFALAPDLSGGLMEAGFRRAVERAEAEPSGKPETGNLFDVPDDDLGVHGGAQRGGGTTPWLVAAGAIGGMALAAAATARRP
ncbi:SDR family oxidoreductase [Oleisolibacter albus]|uniref:SDR family oxidoreductase n=1 Tax=Oleisolibacter albus TaxID=2171757 RepID=UPI000DF1CF82|nr:SDR family oxidoreductase [Oleisolibacter albus]